MWFAPTDRSPSSSHYWSIQDADFHADDDDDYDDVDDADALQVIPIFIKVLADDD